MDVIGSWYVTFGLVWLLAIAFFVGVVAINPPDPEDELLQAWLRDGPDPERDEAAGAAASTVVSL